MTQNDFSSLMTAVGNLEDTNFDELQTQLGQTEFNDDQVIVCVSHCAVEA